MLIGDIFLYIQAWTFEYFHSALHLQNVYPSLSDLSFDTPLHSQALSPSSYSGSVKSFLRIILEWPRSVRSSFFITCFHPLGRQFLRNPSQNRLLRKDIQSSLQPLEAASSRRRIFRITVLPTINDRGRWLSTTMQHNSF